MKTYSSKHYNSWKKLTFWLVLLSGFILIATSCGINANNDSNSISNIFEIDPTFREFYEHLGGEDVMGKPISSVIFVDENKSQFTEKAELIYKPHADPSDLFGLAPLGNIIGIHEPKLNDPEKPGIFYVNGHIVPPDFIPLYEQIGSRFVGKPLTEVHYNPYKKRYEQYFENLAFYRLEGEPQGMAHLLDYGSWFCNQNCSLLEDGEAAIDKTFRIEHPFINFVNQYGIVFSGFALMDGVVNNGVYEQVFENMVLIVDPMSPGGVGLLPVTERLNILPDSMNVVNNDPNFHFYIIEKQKGFGIPNQLWEYIEAHGGIELIGRPISNYSRIADQKYRQCFRNLCLIYDKSLNSIYPEALGYSYREMYMKRDKSVNNAGCQAVCNVGKYHFANKAVTNE